MSLPDFSDLQTLFNNMSNRELLAYLEEKHLTFLEKYLLERLDNETYVGDIRNGR